MTDHPFAELVEQIAERERKEAVADGDYILEHVRIPRHPSPWIFEPDEFISRSKHP